MSMPHSENAAWYLARSRVCMQSCMQEWESLISNSQPIVPVPSKQEVLLPEANREVPSKCVCSVCLPDNVCLSWPTRTRVRHATSIPTWINVVTGIAIHNRPKYINMQTCRPSIGVRSPRALAPRCGLPKVSISRLCFQANHHNLLNGFACTQARCCSRPKLVDSRTLIARALAEPATIAVAEAASTKIILDAPSGAWGLEINALP